ncbi:MAG: YetF domain-containing protein [Bacteroidota bacterium]
MITRMLLFFDNLLGVNTEDLQSYQMAARAIVIFFVAMFFIRISGLRMLGKQSTFDHLTILILGAILGRAIVAPQSLAGTFLAAFILIMLHRFVGWLTYKNTFAGFMFKGTSVQLIKDNVYNELNMSKTQITKNDIMIALRSELNTDDFNEVKDAYLERSGKISIVKKSIL